MRFITEVAQFNGVLKIISSEQGRIKIFQTHQAWKERVSISLESEFIDLHTVAKLCLEFLELHEYVRFAMCLLE